MKFYNTILKVVLPEEILVKARQFAIGVVETTNYTDSNQFSKEKITDDHYISKLGEEAARIVFSNYALVKGPDYGIYEQKNKSWDDDLYIGGSGLAVKTQKRTTANRFGLSWTFQAGTFRRDKILDKPDAWVCFVEYEDINAGNICNVYPPFQMKELKFKDPVLPKLKGHKLVVYASDIKIGQH